MISWHILKKYSSRLCSRFKSENNVPKSFLIPQAENNELSQIQENSENKSLIQTDMKSWIEKQKEIRAEIEKRTELAAGLEKFDNSLTNKLERYKFEKAILSPEEAQWKQLGLLIEEMNYKMPTKTENKISLKKSQELLYKDVMYDNENWAGIKRRITERLIVDYRPVNPKYSTARNIPQAILLSRSFADKNKPQYKKIPYPMKTAIGNYTDNYHWLHDDITQGFIDIKDNEELYTNLVEKKFTILKDEIHKELNSMKAKPNFIPLSMCNYNYTRITNKGMYEFLALYRQKITNTKDAPREEIFGVKDIAELYKNFSKTNPDIKEFVEKLKEVLECQGKDVIYNFIVDPKDQYIAIAFMLEGNKEAKTILIKDLKLNKLMPLLLQNTNGQLVLENETNSLYYLELDINKKARKVYRYNIAKNIKSMMYEENDQNYYLSIQPSKNQEYIFINIESTFKPRTNEVWFKAAQSGKHFTLYSAMKYGVSYDLQQSGEYLYVLTNEGKQFHYLQKSKIPYELQYKPQFNAQLLEENQKTQNLLPKFGSNFISSLPSKMQDQQVEISISQPIQNIEKPKTSQIETDIKLRQTPSKYFMSRNLNVDEFNKSLIEFFKQKSDKNIIVPPTIIKDVFYENFSELPIYAYDVFQHYLIALSSENVRKPQIMVKSLLKDTQHKVILDEMPLRVMFEKNMRYENNVAGFTTLHMKHPENYHEYNMSLRKNKAIPLYEYANLDCSKYVDEKLMIKARDGLEIPTWILYDKTCFNENSPAIIYTNGSNTKINSLAFKPWLASALNRGCTIVYPEMRGTLSLDFNWYLKGILKDKINHFTDLGDICEYLRAQKISKKLSALGESPSGAISVSTVMLKDPKIFDSVCLIVFL